MMTFYVGESAREARSAAVIGAFAAQVKMNPWVWPWAPL
jgi:hypothetical protein